MDKTGVIYILTNPSFPEYVKIGYADDIDKRLQQLNRSECIPFAFRVYATYEVNSRLSDLKIHSIIDKLNPNLRSIENFNAYLSFHGVGKWCAVAFFQLFYRNRKIVKRCSVGINKADLFLDSAYPAAPASFRNYGSIASGACC